MLILKLAKLHKYEIKFTEIYSKIMKATLVVGLEF